MNPTKPLISVIIPLYNRETLVPETLQSVVDQTYHNWECIVVDDGSSDKSCEVVEKVAKKEKRIKLMKRQINQLPKGAPICRNIGACAANGEYLIFLDSDDLLLSNALESRVQFFQASLENDFIVFPTGFFKEKMGDTEKRWNLIFRQQYSDLYRFFNRDTPWHTTGPTWKRESFLSLGGFKEEYFSGDDWLLHVTAICSGLTYRISNDDFKYLDNYVRRGTHEMYTSKYYELSQVKERISMYNYILKNIRVKNFSSAEKRAVIKHFFRFSIQIKELNKDLSLAKKVLTHLRDGLPISLSLFYFLFLRLLLSDEKNTFLIKVIDSILFKIYKLDYILIPQDITIGISVPIDSK